MASFAKDRESESALRIAQLEEEISRLKRSSASSARTKPAPSESTIRASRLEEEVARLEEAIRAKLSAASEPSPAASASVSASVSASSLRADRLAMEVARLQEQLAATRKRPETTTSAVKASASASASAIRADQLENEKRKLEELLAAKTASASARKPSTAMPAPGASTVRADRLEGELVELRAKLAALETSSSRPKNLCTTFMKNGTCRFGDACRYQHDEVARMRNEMAEMELRMAKKDEEMKMLREFSTVRTEMARKVETMKVSFREILENANTLDLVLLMDCTGSMSSWIRAAQEQLCKVVDDIRAGYPELKVRVGFVGYRDFCDGSQRLAVHALSADIPRVQNTIKAQTAFGGGDGPEDIAGAFEAALDMQWQAGAKMVVLAGDAPCHGARYHAHCHHLGGNCSCDSATSIAGMNRDPLHTDKLVARMASSGIDLFILEICPEQTRRMCEVFRTAFEAAPMPVDGFRRCFSAQNMSGTDAPLKLGVTIAASAKVSVESSKSRASSSISMVHLRGAPVSGGKGGRSAAGVSTFHHYGPSKDLGLKLATLCEDEDEEDDETSSERRTAVAAMVKAAINWGRMPTVSTERAVRHSFVFKPGETIDWADLDLKHVTQETNVRVSATYFAEGAMRTAHMLVDANLPDRKLVGKVYKKAIKDVNRQLQQDVVTQTVSKSLAYAYSTQAMGVPVAVDFLFTCYYELVDRPHNDPFRLVAAEPYIPGDYVKYSNNNGWVNKEFSDTAAAFSHFTWQHTYGNLMVVDLQGVGYILTDPQIHSRKNSETTFGAGNLGTDGMAAFFATHTCNFICRHLHLKAFGRSGTSSRSETKGSTAAGALSPDTTTSVLEIDETQSLELSCLLCGDIFHFPRGEYLNMGREGRQVYCPPCIGRMKDERRSTPCEKCREPFPFSPYWYVMIGMEAPKTCRGCKSRAGAISRRKEGAK